jgi:protein SCO1/2
MSRIRPTAFVALAAVGISLAAAVWLIRGSTGPALHGIDPGPETSAAEFALPTEGGEQVSLAGLRGKAVIVYFGYTTCPDVCPLTMARLRDALRLLGPGREDVQVVMITVDPEVDTPEAVAAFARRFDPTFIGLGGDRGTLQAVARAYGVHASEPTAPARRLEGHEEHGDERAHGLPARLLEHSSYLFGIAPDGSLRVLWSERTPPDAIAADLGVILRR